MFCSVIDCYISIVQITQIIPTDNGCSIVVIVNRDDDDDIGGVTPIDQPIQCALLVYRLSFSGLMTGLQVVVVITFRFIILIIGTTIETAYLSRLSNSFINTHMR